MDYLLNKSDNRVVPYSEEAAKSGGNDWIKVDEKTAAAIQNDPSGRARAAFFQARALDEARALYEAAAAAAANAGVKAPPPPPAPAPDPEAQMRKAYEAYAQGKSVPLTEAEKQQGIGDAGETAVAASATPEQIAALPAPGEPDEEPPPSAPAEPAEPAAPAQDLSAIKTAKLREMAAAGQIKAPEGVDVSKASKEQIIAANKD